MKQFKSFVFPETIKKQIDAMNDEMKLKFYIAVTNYGMYDEKPTNFNDIENIIWISMQDLLDNCKQSKGGAPTGNNNASKSQNNQNNQNNLKTTKTTLNNHNDNDNYNDNHKERENKQEKVLENNSKSENENKTLSLNSLPQNNNQDFVVPTQDEVIEYCKTQNLSVNPLSFYNFYMSNNWFVGSHKMTDWKASIRLWQSRTTNQNLSARYPQSNALLVDKSPKEIEMQEKAIDLYSKHGDLTLDKCFEMAKQELEAS